MGRHTDGSGGDGSVAGWGVGIYERRFPTIEEAWVAALYGPVLVQSFDPLWIGATVHTNNTAELSAIGEACRWLLNTMEAPRPQNLRAAHLFYDSTYAFGVATRLIHPTENHSLADTVADLVNRVRRLISLEFHHVKGHSGAPGNEVADRLAARGAAGRVSPHCGAWSTVPPRPLGAVPAPPPPGAKRRAAPTRTQCDKCLADFRPTDIGQHRPLCRGPGDANKKCLFCEKVLGSVQARKNHERYSHPHEALAAGLISALSKRGRGM